MPSRKSLTNCVWKEELSGVRNATQNCRQLLSETRLLLSRDLMPFLTGIQHDVAQQTSTGSSSLDVNPVPPLTTFSTSN